MTRIVIIGGGPAGYEAALVAAQLGAQVTAVQSALAPRITANRVSMVQVYREFPLRAGRVVVRGRRAKRDASTVLRADYALFFKPNIPLAVVEAKDNNHAIGAGMAQAINYAQLLDVPFSFASNGDGFVFRDATLADGVLERNLTLAEFPSPAELWSRYCAWKGWTPEVRQVTEHDYAPAKTPRSVIHPTSSAAVFDTGVSRSSRKVIVG